MKNENPNLTRLAEPFSDDDLEWRVQTSGEKNGRPWARIVPYVSNRAIQERFDQVVGPGNWKNEYREGPAGGVLCGLSVYCAQTSSDGEVMGHAWVTKWDGAENTDVEPVKGGLSGSMKRAAVQWGVGRDLYQLSEAWAIVSENGGHFAKTKEGKAFRWDAPKLADLGAFEAARTPHPTTAAKPAPAPAPAGNGTGAAAAPARDRAAAPAAGPAPAAPASGGDEPDCPKCGGPMWDDRTTKRNPKAPDFKCRDKDGCGGVIWPPREAKKPEPELALAGGREPAPANGRHPLAGGPPSGELEDFPLGELEEDDDLPF